MFSIAKFFVAIDQGNYYYFTWNLRHRLHFSLCCYELRSSIYDFLKKWPMFSSLPNPSPAHPPLTPVKNFKTTLPPPSRWMPKIYGTFTYSFALYNYIHYIKAQDYWSGGIPKLCSIKDRKAFSIISGNESGPSKRQYRKKPILKVVSFF